MLVVGLLLRSIGTSKLLSTRSLRLESDNVFNHTQFSKPVGSFTTPNFGAIVGAAAARQTQLAAKTYFWHLSFPEIETTACKNCDERIIANSLIEILPDWGFWPYYRRVEMSVLPTIRTFNQQRAFVMTDLQSKMSEGRITTN